MILVDLAFAMLVALNAALIAPLYGVQRRRAFGRYSGTVVDPIVLATIVHGVFLLDFVLLYLEGDVTLFELPVHAGDVGILEGLVVYSLFALASFIGLSVGTKSPVAVETKANTTTARDRRLSAVVLLGVFAGAAVVLRELFLILPLILSGATNKQKFFLGNQLMLVLVGLLAPAFALFVAHRRSRSRAVLFAALVVTVVVLLAGSRSSILFVALILAVAAIRDGAPLRARMYGWVLPMGLIALTYLRYLFRESWRFDSLWEFVQARGGIVAVLFSSSEIGLAEGITAIWMRLSSLGRPPFESFLGAFMYPLPRSFFPFKPLSASSYLTAELSPHHWGLTRSEILSSGYGDLLMQFGIVLGIAAVFVLSAAYARVAVRVFCSKSPTAHFVAPFILWWYLVFMRASIFHLGASWWTVAIVILVYQSLRWASYGWERGEQRPKLEAP